MEPPPPVFATYGTLESFPPQLISRENDHDINTISGKSNIKFMAYLLQMVVGIAYIIFGMYYGNTPCVQLTNINIKYMLVIMGSIWIIFSLIHIGIYIYYVLGGKKNINYLNILIIIFDVGSAIIYSFIVFLSTINYCTTIFIYAFTYISTIMICCYTCIVILAIIITAMM